MKQLNQLKTPLFFRVGVFLLLAVLISCQLISGLYAKYSITATGTASVKVANISYKITAETTNANLSSHQLDMNQLPDNCHVVAVEETFSIENDGEVTYDYTLTLTLKDTNNQALADYKLESIADTVWVLSTQTTASFTPGMFYYYLDGVLHSAESPLLTGTLGIGDSVKYTILYFINFENTNLGLENVLNYNLTCLQKD